VGELDKAVEGSMTACEQLREGIPEYNHSLITERLPLPQFSILAGQLSYGNHEQWAARH
jgi:hypothetical protein